MGSRGVAGGVEVEGDLVSVATGSFVLVIFTCAVVWLRVVWCTASPSSAVEVA